MQTFKKNLKVLRQSRHLSPKKLAKSICVSTQTLKNWELANEEPNLTDLIKLCKFFNVRLDDLIGTFEE